MKDAQRHERYSAVSTAGTPCDNLIARACLAVWAVCLAGCREATPPAAVGPPAIPIRAPKQPPVGPRQDFANPQAIKPSGIIPAFRMHGEESGFDFQRQDDIQKQHRILEANGGGVAIFDYDNDGQLDVLMTNGCHLPLKNHDQNTPSELFQNRGQFQFTRVHEAARLMQYGYATGCAVADVDADGFDDLYIAALGPDALWHNNGDGTFSEITQEAGIDCPQWGSSVAFADLNNDGNLDLYVVNYLVESDETPKLCPNPASPDKLEQCPPAMYDGASDVLYVSDGAGRFLDVTAASGVGKFHGKGLGVVVCDFNRDGQQDIYIANDGEANFLFVREAPDGKDAEPGAVPSLKYTERALDAGCALSESGYAQAGMGVTVGDYNADGNQDIFLTHFYSDTNTLYFNHGNLIFEDATRSNILGAASRTKLGFGTAFCDFDNDGWLDVIVANGHIDDRTWLAHGEPYRMQPQIFRNEQRSDFVETTTWSGLYFQQEWLGRGLAVGDLNRDGKMDAVISHQLAESKVLENETPATNGALVLRLIGTRSNRNGYHARVEVVSQSPTLFRELTGGGSFQAASAPEIHIGSDHSRPTTIHISWPGGSTETFSNLTSGLWVIVEGGAATRLPH